MKRFRVYFITLSLSFILILSACGSINSDASLFTWSDEVTVVTNVSEPEVSTAGLQVHFIDVGQADAILLICEDETMLIDGGNRADSDLIYSYLSQQKVTHLDYIIGTHGHEDHIGGLSGALSLCTVNTAYCSVMEYESKAFQNYEKKLGERGVDITVPSPGDSFYLGSAECTILGPITYSEDPNNMSIVLKVQYGETNFLFTGDAEYDEETEILDSNYDISCDVLKVGHHGSSTSTSYRWLREASPKYAVISVGADNDYGHPTEATLSRLRDAEITTYRTDMHGHIICTSDGKDLAFKTQKNPSGSSLDGAGEGGEHSCEHIPVGTQDSVEEPETDVDKVCLYILNVNTGKFHRPSCGSVEKMSAKNKKEVSSTHDEMVVNGYSPCGICNP